jgi:glucosamine-6-phosphate deaminase
MKVSIHPTVERANEAAAQLLAGWLVAPGTRTVMLAAGNSPLELYRQIAARRLPLAGLDVFVLDEYAGVPADEPRNCAHTIRRTAVEPWGVPSSRYFTVSSIETEALESVRRHERRIAESGGIDVLVLGLGSNGHLGFNEPGSAEDCGARVIDLDAASTAANSKWFGGDYAPSRGVTVGMTTIRGARRILLLAFGASKSAAVAAMIEGPRTAQCPASFLQGHPDVHVILDAAAASGMRDRRPIPWR